MLSKYLVKLIQSWGLVHVSINNDEKPFSMFMSIIFLILYLIILSIVKGGGGGAAGINLSSFGGGFHTIDGVNIGPNSKFTSFSVIKKYIICTCILLSDLLSILYYIKKPQLSKVLKSSQMTILSLTISSQRLGPMVWLF